MASTSGMALRPEDPNEWTCEEVGDWLDSQGLSQYKEKFLANEISGAVLVRLDKDSLPELVPNAGDQVHLLRALDDLRGDLDDLRTSLFGPKEPRHVGEAVVGGFSGFANKVYDGFSHLVNDPQEGAKHGGTAGFFKGLGSGLMEAVQRPAEGISILTHQLGTGLKKTPDALFGEENRGYGPPLSSTPEGRIELAKPAFLRDEPHDKPAHVGEGLFYGMKSLGSGMYDGVAGLVTEPMKAARSHQRDPPGIAGVAIAKGFAKGLAGAFCKPIGGALELGTNTVNGLIATPGTIINMTKDGPSIRDTPTMQKIANLKMPTVESLTRTFTGKKEDVSQAIDEIAHTTERSNNVGKSSV